MNNEQDSTRIKKKLIEELSSKSSDIEKILTLSTELSKSDKESVRFTVDAGHINRLGIELVAKKETALSEIVKNAYDADATEVIVSFVSDYSSKRIEILDDGVGMTREQLINGFMRISTTLKEKEQFSEKYSRQRAGKKGIGRFSAQRLGRSLVLITKRSSNDDGLKIKIDWSDFSAEKELVAISNVVSTVSANELNKVGLREHGTILIIDGLRDDWTDSQIKRAYRYAYELLIPFPVSLMNNSALPENSDPGFSAIFKRVMDGNQLIVADTYDMYLKHALAEIEGGIDDKGQGYWRVTSNSLSYDSGIKDYITTTWGQYQEKDSSQLTTFHNIKNIRFKAYYFNPHRRAHIPKVLSGSIFEHLRNHGGVRLYRNGFRVLPYGERFDDWLRLDFFTKNRRILPPTGNNNFFGLVEIDANTQGSFEEVASREGLIENNDFESLREFLSNSILSAVVDINFALGDVKVFANQPNYIKPTRRTLSETLEDIQTTLDELEDAPTPETEESPEEQQALIFSDTQQQSNDEDETSSESSYKKIPEELINELKQVLSKTELYRVLGGLGLSMAEFTHEIGYSLLHISELLDKFESQPSGAASKAAVKLMSEGIKKLEAYTKFFEISFRSLSQESGSIIDLNSLIKEFIDILESSNHHDKNIKILLKASGVDFFTVKTHRANFDSILFNLYSNAKKAINKISKEGSILITLTEHKDTIEMLFSDTGVGIDEKDKDKIFDEFFTTNTQDNNAPETYQMLGMGLGLSIVREIVDSLKGEIEVDTPQDGYQTTFRVIVPKADDKDIENEF